MLTTKGYTAIIDRINETGGLTEDMKKDLDSLKAELDEREGILKRYDESYDGEKEEWDFKGKFPEDYRAEYGELEAKYNGLSARYRDIYENPHDAHETDVAVDDGENDSANDTDYSNLRIDDLITTKED